MPNLIAALLPFVAALLALSTLRLACAAPVAHAHYVSSPRQRYCAAFSGGNFTRLPHKGEANRAGAREGRDTVLNLK